MNFSEWNEKKTILHAFRWHKTIIIDISRAEPVTRHNQFDYSFAFWSNNMIFDVVEWHIAR